MPSHYMESQTNYIAKMSEEEKIVFLKVLVHLACLDSNFEEDEKVFINHMTVMLNISTSKMPEILKQETLESLVKKVSIIRDRQTALHLIKEACLLSNIDSKMTPKEIEFIGKIGLAMGLDLEKIEQISRWVIDRLIWLEEEKVIFEQV